MGNLLFGGVLFQAHGRVDEQTDISNEKKLYCICMGVMLEMYEMKNIHMHAKISSRGHHPGYPRTMKIMIQFQIRFELGFY